MGLSPDDVFLNHLPDPRNQSRGPTAATALALRHLQNPQYLENSLLMPSSGAMQNPILPTSYPATEIYQNFDPTMFSSSEPPMLAAVTNEQQSALLSQPSIAQPYLENMNFQQNSLMGNQMDPRDYVPQHQRTRSAPFPIPQGYTSGHHEQAQTAPSSDSISPQRRESDGSDLSATADFTRRLSIHDTGYYKHPSNVQSRFGIILDAIEEAGFKTVDEMATEYYTTALPESSQLYATQWRSRKNHLQSFLEALRLSTTTWPTDQSVGYRHEILQSAQNILSEELRKSNNGGGLWSRRSPPAGAPGKTPINHLDPDFLVQKFKDLLLHQDTIHVLNSQISHMQTELPGTWSFLSDLVQRADIPQPLGSRLVSAFIFLLSSLD
ncbi:hypothetical protein M501DRAFT_1002316 [Patellaria atrata CBS 101060]|uniref:Uncharacterized protein n=1 Tax=Patellaria atrata CBS 101060 TaxID=1346257 RepID=A0A9P4SCB1_9PEZI|nr:hypothetical protein M501DRAFT_1002316 [Patellaria atrata CBS 101060]